MKGILVSLFILLSAAACGHKSSSVVDGDGGPGKVMRQKKLEAGTNLTFHCPDSFRHTSLDLNATWNQNIPEWVISGTETGPDGVPVVRIALEGSPAATQPLYINVYDGGAFYATISQDGVDQAIYNDGKRNLLCNFN